MSDEQKEATRVIIDRSLEWVGRVLQMLLVALLLWFGTTLQAVTIKIERISAENAEQARQLVRLESRLDRFETRLLREERQAQPSWPSSPELGR